MFYDHFSHENSSSQVRQILIQRAEEEANPQLLISVYDTERNEKAKLRREELVRLLHYSY